MKLFFLLLLVSCTQKYQTYHVIDKHNFDPQNYQAPVSPKLRAAEKKTRNLCKGQFFFSSNAQQENYKRLKYVVKNACPQSNYLLNSKLTETWWTTIIYSRSCMEMDFYCPRATGNETKK